ncbi:hypothetical protein E2562_037055 [Oryza meyeriana var. granulata]|uniref:Uncharacterized protein n=1 Tax=Oryza meyeriana var. granulata TaxID=110450 RepID=A0A6G1ETL2_9ORYZ|nr:hypothetical protein E2562_037055 [Oryza meyeriana var. granulata]
MQGRRRAAVHTDGHSACFALLPAGLAKSLNWRLRFPAPSHIFARSAAPSQGREGKIFYERKKIQKEKALEPSEIKDYVA